MAEPVRFPPPTPEQRKAAVGQYERAQQVIATSNFDYGIQLLLACCRLDPGNLVYRKTLRQVEKNKYKNNLYGSRLALLTNTATKAKIKTFKHTGDYLKVLELGEEALTRNPWDTGAQMDMAGAADALGLLDLGVWLLEQARQKDPKDATVNRALARLLEKRGNFNQAIKLWDLIRAADPKDREAWQKCKDLAASETIARGQYGQAVGVEDTPAKEAGAKEGAAKETGAKDYRVQREAPTFSLPEDRLAREVAQAKARIEADPANANAYLTLSGIYRRAERLDEARTALEEGAQATGNPFDLTVALADLDIENFRRDLAHAEEKLRKQPQDEELRRLRGRLQKEINARELELYRQKSERYPTDKALHFEFGVRLLKAGQIDEAIRELQTLRTDPRFQWKALMYLGYCFKNRNNWRLAQRNFEEALQCLPAEETGPRKDILFHLAQGFAEAGDLAKAVDIGNDLANIDFSHRDIGRLLDEWQAKLQG